MSKRSAGKQGKKGKGHRPAHENNFAFIHNANSKKTKKILEMPNEGLCRRCHDKIEWRKKYRKYKPLKVPAVCNYCHQKDVKAAYHKACRPCASAKKVCPSCLKCWKELHQEGRASKVVDEDVEQEEQQSSDELDTQHNNKDLLSDKSYVFAHEEVPMPPPAPVSAPLSSNAASNVLVNDVVSTLVSRYETDLESLVAAHLDWTLDISMDSALENSGEDQQPQATNAEASRSPLVLSPFLASRPAAIAALLTQLLPDLGSHDSILDVGCGDGRVLVAASRLTGCRGVGIDVSPHCIRAARSMVIAEDTARPVVDNRLNDANSRERGDMLALSFNLAERLSFFEVDCTSSTDAISQYALKRGGSNSCDGGGIIDHDATVCYLYVYPTLLEKIRPQIEELSRRRRPWPHQDESLCRIVTVGYHFDGWPAAKSIEVHPDEDGAFDDTATDATAICPPSPHIDVEVLGENKEGIAGSKKGVLDGKFSNKETYEIRLLRPAK